MKRSVYCVVLAIFWTGQVIAQTTTINENDLDSLDRNGDGAVSQSEYEAFSKFAFKTMDKNSDGALSPNEVDDHVVGDAFEILDDDGNGSVSAEEFFDQLNEDFNAADKDADGALDGSI